MVEYRARQNPQAVPAHPSQPQETTAPQHARLALGEQGRVCGARGGWEHLAVRVGLDRLMGLGNVTRGNAHDQALCTVEQEYAAYTTAPCSPDGTNMFRFWTVSHTVKPSL